MMRLKDTFIKATEEFNTLEKNVPAYYFRRSYVSSVKRTAKLTIAVCGFYELFWNGERITRGFLSPYISNPNDCVYYDEYDLPVDAGENVLGIILGNGFQNNPGGYIWDFDKADFRSAPMVSVTMCAQEGNCEAVLLESDTNFKVAPSAILSDDYRFGEYYDANFEIEGWAQKGFDDSEWSRALSAKSPKGELCLADVAPIVKAGELHPVSVTKCGDGYIYDFGISNAGVCRLKIKGAKGQKIELRHTDALVNGDVDMAQVWFVRDFWERDKDLIQKDTYVCKGDGVEEYSPSFTYHGFRYVRVDGITEAQAQKDLITFIIYHTELNTVGDFVCSDQNANKLQEIARRSILSNFHHFPTDCPQREKNGWTADAALTSETALLNFDPERNYAEWLRNVRKAQKADGSLPGIVPTAGWGFEWGNGPAWDAVLAQLPYYVYIYRGKTDMIRDSAESFISYLRYLRSRCDENGLLSIGLGDWCHVGGLNPKAPLLLTDSIMALDIARKIADMLEAIGDSSSATYAREQADKYRASIRAHLIDFKAMSVVGDCQSSQAMGLYYGIFDSHEKNAAFNKLLELVRYADDHIDVGVLGGRVIFEVLSEFGYSNLAFKMIMREDYPSYGNWLSRGATTLWENFLPDGTSSMNHHFWGHISGWFMKYIGGIKLNPTGRNVNSAELSPVFIEALDWAKAYHNSPKGKISVSWKREKNYISLEVDFPADFCAVCKLEKPYCFENGESIMEISSGMYKIIQSNG